MVGPQLRGNEIDLMNFLIGIKEKLKASIDADTLLRIRKYQSLNFRSFQHVVFRLFFGSNLKSLSVIYGCGQMGNALVCTALRDSIPITKNADVKYS